MGVDPQHVVREALRQGYRIGECAACGGPEIFSKTTPTSKCFRCGQHRELDFVKPTVSHRRCALCDRQDMTGIPLAKPYCAACQSLPRAERAKRLRDRPNPCEATHD